LKKLFDTMVLTECNSSSSDDEYLNSPGRIRQEEEFRWKWDICESNVRSGHDCITSNDRVLSKFKKAKLTFGEVLDAGVMRMLYNLGTINKKRFHDLGMGTGKMLLQTYLSFPNLQSCVGVELSKGRYMLAEQNLTRLLRRGWRGRKFRLVEFREGVFMKIVESPYLPRNGFKIGESVIAFNKHFRKCKNEKFDYRATVIGYSGDKIVVRYGGKRTYKVDLDLVFEPGTERTCEIWQGSLFDYPWAWNADVCILETDFPSEMHNELISCMTKTPVGCTFLTYHDLKKLANFRSARLRQLDVNVYDSDRYLTSWSQGWRFYCWEHVRDLKEIRPLPSSVTALSLSKEDRIRVYQKSKKRWVWGKARAIHNSTSVEVEFLDGRKTVIYGLRDNRLALHRPRFSIGEVVAAFHPDWAYRMQFSMFTGKVVNHNADGSYCVSWETCKGFRTLKIPEYWVFARNKYSYNIGDNILSCWTDYALNKNSPLRYKKFTAVIKDINANGTYAVEFEFGNQKRFSDSVREMWITSEKEEEEYEVTLEQWDEDPISSLCIQVANKWTPQCVATFLVECSHEMHVDLASCVRMVLQNEINGKAFTAMNQASLESVLGMNTHFAKDFYERYMYWVHTRMENPPANAQRKREKMSCEVPGGGPLGSRMS